MKVIAKGSANILIDYGDPTYLYRCLIRDTVLSVNNFNTIENFEFIKAFKSDESSALGSFVCPMTLLHVPVCELKPILEPYISVFDSEKMMVFKILNLKANCFNVKLQNDHFTTLYGSSMTPNKILIEVKPKWLHYASVYCRNCTHNNLKNRSDIQYCYTKLINDETHFFSHVINNSIHKLPSDFILAMTEYFKNKDNIFKLLYQKQKELYKPLISIKGTHEIDTDILLLMALRDVTIFIEWDSIANHDLNINIIDVDKKPTSKLGYWLKNHHKLENHPEKVVH